MADWGFERAVLDTNVVWAAYSRRSSGDTERCRRILHAGVREELDLVVSTITLVELFKVPDGEVTLDDLGVLEDALRRPGWRFVELEPGIALLARELALRYGISKAYDCAQLATAVSEGADVLISHDASDFVIDNTYDGVRVILPPEPRSPELFDFDQGS